MNVIIRVIRFADNFRHYSKRSASSISKILTVEEEQQLSDILDKIEKEL